MFSQAALFCLLQAAAVQSLPPHVLVAIRDVEGGRAGYVRENTNGTRDLGMMQVNTVHLPRLSALTGLPMGSVEERLVQDDCFNVQVAAFLLAGKVQARGGDLWAGVGDYHSRTDGLHQVYRAKVEAARDRIREQGWLADIVRRLPALDHVKE